MKKPAFAIFALLAGFGVIIGCSDSTALSAKEKENIKGSAPPKDVWDKVGEARANQPDRSKDYGTIPGQSTSVSSGTQTPGPSVKSGQ